MNEEMKDDKGSPQVPVVPPLSKDSREFLVEDYKLKVSYLMEHFGRMWTRFNFFLTVELALFGLLGFLLFQADKPPDRSDTLVPIVLGIVTAVIWYVVGAEDRSLVEGYRLDIKATAWLLSKNLKGMSWYSEYYVGSKKGAPGYAPAEQKQIILRRSYERLVSWYWEPISITRLAAILPIVLLLVWLVSLVMWSSNLSIFIRPVLE